MNEEEKFLSLHFGQYWRKLSSVYMRNGRYSIESSVKIYSSYSWHYQQIPVYFEFIEGEIELVDFIYLNTLKKFVDNINGKITIVNCPLIDEREVEIVNNDRLRKHWNESTLNLEEFIQTEKGLRGLCSSKKFGF